MGKQAKRGAAVAVAVIGIVLLAFVGILLHDRQNVGKEGHIVGEVEPGRTVFSLEDSVPATSDSNTLYSLGKLPTVEQQARAQELERSGEIFRILRGTRVLVLGHKFLGVVSEVRFLDGTRQGQTAWVADDDFVLNP